MRSGTVSDASGRWVVAVMFIFAATVVGSFWVYWGLSNRPFRPLQAAILAEYPDTFPQVAGGFARGESGATLRVVVRTFDFDPNEDRTAAESLADRIEELADETLPLADYRTIEVILFHTYREKRGEYWIRTHPIIATR